MANKLYAVVILAFFLISCMINETIETRPNYVASTPFTSTAGKQIIKISDTELIITSSIIAKNDDSDYENLTRFRAIKSAYDYFWQTNVDPNFISLYSENMDKIDVIHFLDLKRKVRKGILEKIENIETNTTFLGSKQILASKYRIKFYPPKNFTSDLDFMYNLNKEKFNSTDTLSVFLQTTSPCYVQLFLLQPDKHIVMLKNSKDKPYLIPGKIHKFSNQFINQNSGNGVVKILASDKPIEFEFDRDLKKSLDMLLNQLANSKISNLTEIDLEFTVK